jgi:hypothetical protein
VHERGKAVAVHRAIRQESTCLKEGNEEHAAQRSPDSLDGQYYQAAFGMMSIALNQ